MPKSVNDDDGGSCHKGDDDLNSTGLTTNDDGIVGKEETKAVLQLKLAVVFVLVLSALAVGLGTYFYIRQSENKKFVENYQSDAFKVMESIGSNIENSIAALDLMATTIVSHARSANDTWPFVTLPNFGNRASKTLSMCAGMVLWFTALVKPEERLAWEKYVSKQQGIVVNETLHIMETDRNYRGIVNWDVPRPIAIQGDYDTIPYNQTRLYNPIWQQYPIASQGYPAFNWDWYSDEFAFNTIANFANGDQRAVITCPYLNPDPNNPAQVEDDNQWANIYKSYIDENDDPMEPVSDILYPIIDELNRIEIFDDNGNSITTQPVTLGNIATSFYWRDVLRNVLPRKREGIIVVVDNACEASFTYQINGPNTQLLGRGDLHDPRFDYLGQHANHFELKPDSLIESKYTGIPVHDTYCPFTINVYPSVVYEDDYITHHPITFALVAVFIFIFTSIVFIAYDCKVERRQQIVMSSAVRSNAVISSLFPSNVRDQILESSLAFRRTSNKKLKETDSKDIGKFLHRNSIKSASDIIEEIKSSRPIADLYSDTTVLFSDIKGFTAWSSARDPYQVFTLLETLYCGFDNIARERRVFKVETIGDSYVAVAGLPDPMKNHAVVMVRFAEAMLLHMTYVTQTLSSTLGPDTGDLALRVGINSGPTTAGVLRGEKSRFQLFGDTVNTASRMESNGLPGRIQCSQRTADLLIESGKENWLTKREGLVHAKGKGAMQTYWVKSVDSSSTQESSLGKGSFVTVNENQRFLARSKYDRLVEWNCTLFLRLIDDIRSYQELDREENTKTGIMNKQTSSLFSTEAGKTLFKSKSTPHFFMDQSNGATYITVRDQIINYITKLASMYEDAPFYNFEHASHVLMATINYLEKIDSRTVECSPNVSVDPFQRLAIVFASLVNDLNTDCTVSAPVVGSGTVVPTKDPEPGAESQSCSSVDIAWEIFLTHDYDVLRHYLFPNDGDIQHFYNNVVQLVSIMDTKELLQNATANYDQLLNKAEPGTIFGSSNVTQHLVRAAAVVHTMQHWCIYQKWTKRRFQQLYISSRTSSSVSPEAIDSWYRNELSLFDNYVTPLLQNLNNSGFSSAACNKLVNFAKENRLEWERKGLALVTKWMKQGDMEVSSHHSFVIDDEWDEVDNMENMITNITLDKQHNHE